MRTAPSAVRDRDSEDLPPAGLVGLEAEEGRESPRPMLALAMAE